MKIKWGALVTDGRGKLGGHVASKNRSGSYLRTKVTPVNPQTTFQTSIRALFGAISGAWSLLTNIQRATWSDAVEDWQKTDVFGDLKNPSGKNLHQRLNLEAQRQGYPVIQTAPAKVVVPSSVLSSATLAIGAGTLVLTGFNVASGSKTVVSSTGSLSQGTKFVKNKLTRIYVSEADAYVSAQCYLQRGLKYGNPVVGANIYISVKTVMPNGQSSVPQTVKAVVVA